MLVRQALYHFSHTWNPFLLTFFKYCLSFAQADLNHVSLINACNVVGMKGMCKHNQLFFLVGCDLANFLHRQASNHNPPYLCIHSSWNYRCKLLC
jgi:hypothetical protein